MGHLVIWCFWKYFCKSKNIKMGHLVIWCFRKYFWNFWPRLFFNLLNNIFTNFWYFFFQTIPLSKHLITKWLSILFYFYSFPFFWVTLETYVQNSRKTPNYQMTLMFILDFWMKTPNYLMTNWIFCCN